MAKINAEGLDLKEQVVKINRVSKVVKGGKRFSFSALVVVGNKEGVAGIGLGKAGEVMEAIKKGVEIAKKNLFRAPLKENTIPHQICVKYGAAQVLLKPAAPGTGIIAGGSVRAVVELIGVKDILAKSLGSDNTTNIVYATVKALKELKDVSQVARLRGKTVQEVIN